MIPQHHPSALCQLQVRATELNSFETDYTLVEEIAMADSASAALETGEKMMGEQVHLAETTTQDADDKLLIQLGHVQELRRGFSIRSLGGLCLCLMATWEALSTVVATALISGGAPCLFYN
jgi:hypothetical protein